MPSQDQISTPSKVKATQVQLKPYRSRGKGLVPVWHSLHSKAGPFHASEGKSAVNMQVAELQRKIQLLGKMTPEGPEWSSQQPSDLAGGVLQFMRAAVHGVAKSGTHNLATKQQQTKS